MFFAVLLAVLFILPLVFDGFYFIHVCVLIMIYIIATSSLRTIYISGQQSVGHAAFMGIGGYASALLVQKLDWSPWLCMLLIGPAVAAVVAFLSGYLFSRIRAVYFSMVTLFLGVAVVAVMISWVSVTGGNSGIYGIPGLGEVNIPRLLDIDFDGSKVAFYYLVLVLTVLSLAILYRLEYSRIGMTWKAIAQSPVVAASTGISETKFRVLNFTVGCLFAGLAGSLFAHYNGVLSPNSFGLSGSIYLVIYMLFGGLSSFAGPIIGVVILMAVPELFRFLKEYAPFVLSGLMLIVIFWMPQGLAGVCESIGSRVLKQRQKQVETEVERPACSNAESNEAPVEEGHSHVARD